MVLFHPDGPSLLELAQQALSSTERGYDRLAPKFDVTPFRTPPEIVAAVVDAIPGELGRAVDLCCGTGVGVAALAGRCSESVVGVDISQGMLAEARRHCDALTGTSSRTSGAVQPRISFERADVLDWSGGSQRFDAVTCFGAFGHIPAEDEASFIQRIHTLLRPGGYFAFATATAPAIGSRAWLLSHGFNALMRLRNALLKPPFIMYYLTFLLPAIGTELERHGFRVQLHDPQLGPPWQQVRVVTAMRDD